MATTTRKTDPPADGPVDRVTANGPEVSHVDPRGLQPDQKVTGLLSTNPPRGVGEPAADAVPDEDSAAAVRAHMQGVLDGEEANGWRGNRRTKAVPNKNYTLAGVNAGLPTPETVVYTPESA